MLDDHPIPFPDRGSPHTGHPSVTRPAVTKDRSPVFYKKRLLALYVEQDDGKQQPISIAKIQSLFVDNIHGLTWARVLWYGNPEGKFLGTYREKEEGATPPWNMLLPTVPHIPEPFLLHWDTRGRSNKSVLTSSYHIRLAVVKLAFQDVRMQADRLRKQFLEADASLGSS